MNSQRPNIVWLTVDSIRADHTSVHGYPRNTTPNLSKIANMDDGRSFNNCISEGIWSLPVGTSILTGTYPTFHNTVAEDYIVPNDIKTVPELFSSSGYETYGVSGNPWVSDATNMNRGFDHFEYISKSNLTAAGLNPLIKFLLNLRSHSAGYTTNTAAHCTDYIAHERIRKWIHKQTASQPFFIYAHTEGAHTPYYPPNGYIEEFTEELGLSPKEARSQANELCESLYERMANGLDLTTEEKGSLIAAYDGIIKYLDEQIGKTFDVLKSKSLGPTIFVVTSDHGDHLGEKGVLSHKLSLRDELARVPMVVHGTEVNKENKLVQHLDFIKEIAVRAGCDDEQLQGNFIGDRQAALIHRSEDYFNKTRGILDRHGDNLNLDKFHEQDANAIRTNKYKYVRSEDKSVLYKLPDETQSILNQYSEEAVELDNRLDKMVQKYSRAKKSDKSADFDDEMKETLSDLGYL